GKDGVEEGHRGIARRELRRDKAQHHAYDRHHRQQREHHDRLRGQFAFAAVALLRHRAAVAVKHAEHQKEIFHSAPFSSPFAAFTEPFATLCATSSVSSLPAAECSLSPAFSRSAAACSSSSVSFRKSSSRDSL